MGEVLFQTLLLDNVKVDGKKIYTELYAIYHYIKWCAGCDVSEIQILKRKMDMEFYQDRISKLLKELRESLACNFDNEQIERLNASLQQFGSA